MPLDLTPYTKLCEKEPVITKKYLLCIFPDLGNTLWNVLIHNGYITSKGVLRSKLKKLTTKSQLDIGKVNTAIRDKVYHLLNSPDRWRIPKKKYRDWVLTDKCLMLGDFDQELGAGWNTAYHTVNKKIRFILCISIAQSLMYDKTIGVIDGAQDIGCDHPNFAWLRAFYRENNKVDRITLRCVIKATHIERQPKQFEFLLPYIWEKYHIYKKIAKDNAITLKRKDLEASLNAYFLDAASNSAEIRNAKRMLDRSMSGFYADCDVIFSDIYQYITKMDMIVHLPIRDFMLAIKNLTHFAQQLHNANESVDAVNVLYNLFSVSKRLVGKIYSTKEEHANHAEKKLRDDDLCGESDKHGRELIPYRTYCAYQEGHARDIKKMIADKDYVNLQNEINKQTVEDFNIFKKDFFGKPPIIRDALNLFLWDIYCSVDEGFANSKFSFKCLNCGKIVYKDKKHRFCSDECRRRYNSKEDYYKNLPIRRKNKLKTVKAFRKRQRLSR